MLDEEIIGTNKKYWNDHADLWFGTTALYCIEKTAFRFYFAHCMAK